MRTDREIVDQTNELAAKLYLLWGYKASEGFRFDKSNHGHEQIAWQQACIAQEMLTGTDVDDCLAELGED